MIQCEIFRPYFFTLSLPSLSLSFFPVTRKGDNEHTSAERNSLLPTPLFSFPKRFLVVDDLCRQHPPAHSRYRSEGPVAAIRFKGDRKDQTALARLSSCHLETLRFSYRDKKFDICPKCNMIEATPQHLLDCVALVYDDLHNRPDLVLEVMKAKDLMDLI
ncbi:hypothetical protein AVEN_258002-1 [Araneus ventricosus]|uniref:Uncharacterized protein n=1 Tax=Araneus ventricosus TaxID=182803 RepID=A0A4Y2L601_ARAVE|nr:hypothetical protein AVEN_258002-1 [Araneus ventricosus]